MLPTHLTLAPESAYVGNESVQVETLTEFLKQRFPEEMPPFALKLDTQGFENDILDGLGDCIRYCSAVLLEMPLVELYEGAADLPTLFARLCKSGFRCVGMSAGHRDTRTGDCAEVDVLFVRTSLNCVSKPFYIYTSVPPQLTGQALSQQQAVLASWRAVGFTPILVSPTEEVEQVAALGLNAEVEPVASSGRPLIEDILEVIMRRSTDVAGIVNADCRMLYYPNAALALEACLDGALLYAQRIDTINGSPLFGVSCGGFDAFFFDVRFLRGIRSPVFRIGETWWDYWFPLRMAANGARIGLIGQPLITHERHPLRWDQEEWKRNAEHCREDMRHPYFRVSLPPEILQWLAFDSLGPDTPRFAVDCFNWFRRQKPPAGLQFLGKEHADLERLTDVEFLLGASGSAPIRELELRVALAGTEQKLSATEQSLNATKAALDATELKLDATEAALGATELKLNATEATLGATELKFNATKAALDWVHDSTSWKVTGPLRGVGSILRSLRNSRPSTAGRGV